MQHHKQKKKPYVAPKCEVYRIGKCNLMDFSGSMGGFEDGGSLSKKHEFYNESIFDSNEDFTWETDNSQMGKEIKP